MKLGRIFVLLVLVAGLGAYLYFYEVPQAEKAAKKEKLVTLDKDAVTGVTLTYPDRELELKKGDKGWRLVKPVDAPADDAAVKAVISTLADAEVQKTLDEAPADPDAFGLEKPSPRVTLTVASGQSPPAIAVGKNTVIGGKTYVRRGDETKVYLTASTIGFGLNKQAKDLREKDILHFQDDDVARVEIAPADGKTVTLVRKDKDSFTVEPGDLPADATEARSFLASLRSVRALDFPDDAPADLQKYGLAKPRLAITVATGKEGAESQTLLFGGDKTEGSQTQVYAKRANAPSVYAIADWSFKSLGKTAVQLRDKTVLGFDPARVKEILLEHKDGAALTLARAGGTWSVQGAEGKKPNDQNITRFLDDLRELRGSDVAAEPAGGKLKPFGLDAPALRVTLTDADGQPMGTVLLAKQGAKYYAMRAGADTVFEMRDYMYTRLDKQQADFIAPDTPATVAPPTPVPPPGGEPDGEEEPED